MPVTIKDVAREAGVSISTVSKILNDVPGISEPTRPGLRARAPAASPSWQTWTNRSRTPTRTFLT